MVKVTDSFDGMEGVIELEHCDKGYEGDARSFRIRDEQAIALVKVLTDILKLRGVVVGGNGPS